jgi:branched-chain amino acid transport system ATP-binding protein
MNLEGAISGTMLKTDNLTKTFGGVTAINKVSVEFPEGKIIGLIGPNGAGKSTLFKLITGVLKPDEGNVEFKGIDITGKPGYKVSRLGTGYVFQESLLYESMTLMENMLVTGNTGLNPGLLSLLPYYQRKKELEVKGKIREILDSFDLLSKIDLFPNQLSYGDKRRALIARSVVNNCSLLLLDEPSAGMNPAERKELVDNLLYLKNKGFTICIVEHNLRMIMSICDYIYVLNFGKLICKGTPAEVSCDEAVIEAYIGKKNDQ